MLLFDLNSDHVCFEYRLSSKSGNADAHTVIVYIGKTFASVGDKFCGVFLFF